MPAHPVKARLRPTRGHLQEGWSRGTPPAWRPRDETRAPDTLVDAIFGAIAGAGSIPAVSTSTVRRFGFRIGDRGVFLVVDPLSAAARTRSPRTSSSGSSAPRRGSHAALEGARSTAVRYAQVLTS